ncbi:MAG: hypothetical protein HXL70_08130 [Dialister invisus]|uniref:Uncharacterized protein n=1 Tax=Dialister invisus TaxID=218538 RepID=A0A930FQ70_9FIRM|nr:hypothetical protein [Dialister invisus]
MGRHQVELYEIPFRLRGICGRALNIPAASGGMEEAIKNYCKKEQESRSCFFLGNVQKYLLVFFRKRSPGFSA